MYPDTLKKDNMSKQAKVRPEESVNRFINPSSNQQPQKEKEYKLPRIGNDELEKILNSLPEVVLSNVLKEWRKSVNSRQGKNVLTNEDMATIVRKFIIMIKDNGDKNIRNIDLLFNEIVTYQWKNINLIEENMPHLFDCQSKSVVLMKNRNALYNEQRKL